MVSGKGGAFMFHHQPMCRCVTTLLVVAGCAIAARVDGTVTRVTGIRAATRPLSSDQLVVSDDSRPSVEKVSPGLLAHARHAQGELDVLVMMREPVALRELAASAPGDPVRLRWMAATADALERDLVEYNVRVTRRYSQLPVLRMSVPLVFLQVLAADPRIDWIGTNRRTHALDREGNQLMNVPAVQSLGFKGGGVAVAVLDTGVDYEHPELSPGGTDAATSKTIKLLDAVDHDDDPMDEEGHGTSVAGIVAGRERGVAPDAKIVAVRVLDSNGDGTEDQLLEGLNAVLASVTGGNPYGIKVANLSLGGYDDQDWPPGSGTCDELDAPTAEAFASLSSAGVAVIVAAGNGGCTDGVAWPACLSAALAVGAVYDDAICTMEVPLFGCVSHTQYFGPGQCMSDGCSDEYKADRIACYSDSGEKLGVWAPSDCARTAGLDGETVDCFNGTSASAPYASGVAALLSQAVPARTSGALLEAIKQTGKPITDARNGITRNRIDAQAALAQLQACAPPPAPTSFRSDKLSVCSGEQFTVSWDAVSDAASYTAQVSADAEFSAPTEAIVAGTSASFSVNLTTAGTLSARVRANAGCGAASDWSAVLTLSYNPGCGTPDYTRTYWVSGIGHLPGVAPAFWYSDVAILNLSAAQADIRIRFYGNATSPSFTTSLPPLQQVTWRDILVSLFAVAGNDVGVLLVESTQPLAVSARTYSAVDRDNSTMTYGQSYEGLEVAQALSGATVGYLANLRSDAPFRTNVEFVNVGAVPATVEVRFFTNSGSYLGTLTRTVASNQRVAVTSALPSGNESAFAEARVTPIDARVIGFASVIDGASTDPTTVPLVIP